MRGWTATKDGLVAVHHRRRDYLRRAHLLHLLDRLFLLSLVGEGRGGGLAGHLQLGLDLTKLPAGQHLDVGANLFPSSRLGRP